MSVVTRFAPSPTGALHLGHAYAAVVAHDLARAQGGRFLIRFDDLDTARVKPGMADAIVRQLGALGLEPDDAPVYQSQRTALYDAALATLAKAELTYPCFCTRRDIAAEIAASASAPHGIDGPLYPGTCRHVSPQQRAARIAAGEPHAVRLDVARAAAQAGPLWWEEWGVDNPHPPGATRLLPSPGGRGRGPREAWEGEGAPPPEPNRRPSRHPCTPLIAGDVVLKRRDGAHAYHLASTIDDAALGISNVTRGADLFGATHVHRLLQAVLDLPTPRYHHHALVADAQGRRLATRDAAADLDALSRSGYAGKSLGRALREGRLPLGFRLIAP